MNDISFYISIGSLALVLILAIVIFTLHTKIKKLLVGGADNIPDSLDIVRQRIESIEKSEKEIVAIITTLQKKVARSVQSTELVRFTPFSGIGSNGNQSFSLAFLNEQGNGIVLSGLYYSRDRVSIFTKPVEGFSSSFELTPEEKEVILRSKQGLQSI